MKKLLSLFLLCSIGSFLQAGEYPDISVKELQKAIKDGKVTVIDVNGAKSFKRGHIPTAIDFSSQGKNLGKLLQRIRSSWLSHIAVDRVAVHTSVGQTLLPNWASRM